MFRAFRRNSYEKRLRYHLDRIHRSLAMRREYQTEDRRGMVLAVNYELMSDATRALDALRRVEELTPDHKISADARAEHARLRRKLKDLTDLPALPLWRVQGEATESQRATAQEINTLYRRFQVRESDGRFDVPPRRNPERSIDRDPVRLAKKTIAYAVHGDESRWSEITFSPPDRVPGSIIATYEAGRPSEMRLDDAACLCGVLNAEFELEMSQGDYYRVPLPAVVMMRLLQHVWQQHIEHDAEPIDLRFWFRQMRHLASVWARSRKRNEELDVHAFGAVAVERLSSADLPVTPMRVRLYSALGLAVRRWATAEDDQVP